MTGETRDDSGSKDEMYAKISPKARTQIQHFINVIKGRPEDVRFRGRIQQVEIEVICGPKTKYDIITTGAITAIKNGGGAVKCEKATADTLPKILTMGKTIEFKVANIEIEIHGQSARFAPIIIRSDVICVTLSGGSINTVIGNVLYRKGFHGGKVMMERKGRELLREWMKEDRAIGNEEGTITERESAETGIEEAESSQLESIGQQRGEEEGDESEEESNGSDINSTVTTRLNEGTEAKSDIEESYESERGRQENNDQDSESNEVSEQEVIETDEVIQVIEERQSKMEGSDGEDDEEAKRDEERTYEELQRIEEELKREVAELEERKRKRNELINNVKRSRKRRRMPKRELREERGKIAEQEWMEREIGTQTWETRIEN